MTYPISDISFELEETHVAFSFDSENFSTANLQLPSTADSEHWLDDVELDLDDEQHAEIFEQLKRFYFDAFKSVECAAASAEIGIKVLHVEEVDGFYVAFTEDSEVLLKESRYRSYYNKAALFDIPTDEDLVDIDPDDIIQSAKECFNR